MVGGDQGHVRAAWTLTSAPPTEAARAAKDHGFHTLGYARLISLIDPGNLASRRVAEKVGLTLEKEVEKWGKRICVYAKRKGRSAT